jgi:hypothetical protein
MKRYFMPSLVTLVTLALFGTVWYTLYNLF